MKNIDSAFKLIRSFCMLVIIVCSIISVYAIYSSHELVTRSNQRVYVLAGGKALEAFVSQRNENLSVEARDHVRSFHQYFFSLDPDEKVINNNVKRALALADRTAKDQYDNLKENNYYSNIISGNVSQVIDIDSVQIDLSVTPYYFKCSGTLKILRSSSIVTRNLMTDGFLRNVARSDDNPHGFLIEKWRILENKDIKTEQR